jgi:hypothetical protein
MVIAKNVLKFFNQLIGIGLYINISQEMKQELDWLCVANAEVQVKYMDCSTEKQTLKLKSVGYARMVGEIAKNVTVMEMGNTSENA